MFERPEAKLVVRAPTTVPDTVGGCTVAGTSINEGLIFAGSDRRLAGMHQTYVVFSWSDVYRLATDCCRPAAGGGVDGA